MKLLVYEWRYCNYGDMICLAKSGDTVRSGEDAIGNRSITGSFHFDSVQTQSTFCCDVPWVRVGSTQLLPTARCAQSNNSVIAFGHPNTIGRMVLEEI